MYFLCAFDLLFGSLLMNIHIISWILDMHKYMAILHDKSHGKWKDQQIVHLVSWDGDNTQVMYLEPKWPGCFAWKGRLFGGFNPQNARQIGSRFINKVYHICKCSLQNSPAKTAVKHETTQIRIQGGLKRRNSCCPGDQRSLPVVFSDQTGVLQCVPWDCKDYYFDSFSCKDHYYPKDVQLTNPGNCYFYSLGLPGFLYLHIHILFPQFHHQPNLPLIKREPMFHQCYTSSPDLNMGVFIL